MGHALTPVLAALTLVVLATFPLLVLATSPLLMLATLALFFLLLAFFLGLVGLFCCHGVTPFKRQTNLFAELPLHELDEVRGCCVSQIHEIQCCD